MASTTDPDHRRAPGRLRRGAAAAGGRVRRLFETGGTGFRDLALVQAASTMHDALVAVALAGTLFFTVPSAEARGNVALYLLLTVAPFSLIGPLLGRLLRRSPLATRGTLLVSAAARAGAALALIGRHDDWLLFPLAFALLVLSRVHAIARHSLLPVALPDPGQLVAANSRLAWIGVLAGGVAGALGVGATLLLGPDGALALAVVAAAATGLLGRRLPDPADDGGLAVAEPGADVDEAAAGRGPAPRRRVRLAQVATAGVRLLNGFLLLLLAFAFHRVEGGLLDLGALVAAAGAGFALAALVAPRLERRLREEPMVVAALAIEAAAAFVTAQWFSLPAAAALATAAGFAWGTAKLAFDGLLQAAAAPRDRGTAFTRSETLFAIAWVLGALVPTAVPMPARIGLSLAGIAALGAQILYVAVLLTPDGRLADTATRDRSDGH